MRGCLLMTTPLGAGYPVGVRSRLGSRSLLVVGFFVFYRAEESYSRG